MRTTLLAFTAVLALAGTAPVAQAQDGAKVPGGDAVSFEAERMLASILRSAPGGIGVVVDRVIVQVNDYILQLTGYSRDELLGKNARIFYPSDEDYKYVGDEKYRQIAEKGTGTVETRWITRDGKILEVILSSTPLNIDDLGAGVVFTVTDVTEKNRITRALRDRTRGSLVGMAVFLAFLLLLIAALARTSAVRRRTAEDLRAKTEELDRYFTSSLDLLCIADSSGHFIRLNPEWERVLGYPIRELEGKRFLDLVHPDDLPGTLDALNHLERQDTILNFTNRYRCKDGSYRWIEWRSRPVGTTIYAVARDVNDRKLAEEALGRNRATLNLVLNAIPQSVFWKDLEGRFLGCNQAFARDSGLDDPDRILGKTDLDLSWAPEDADSYQADDREVAKTGRPKTHYMEYLQRTDGSRIMVDITKIPLVEKSGRTFGVLGVYEDITERRKTEQLLEQANLVVENSPAVLFRWKADEDWPTLMVSENVRQFGYSREELVSGEVPFSTLVHPEDLPRVEAEVRENSGKGLDRFVQEYRIVARDGSVRWVDDRTKVVRDTEGRIQEYQGILIDITERKLAEADLERSLNFQAALLDAIPAAVFFKDRKGRYRGCNKVFTEIMGVASEQLRGRTVQELWPGDMAETYHREDLKLMEVPARQTYEYKVKDRNGIERPVIFSKDVFRDERGNVAGIVGAFLDITERRRAEEELKALNETLEQRIRDRTRELGAMNASLVQTNVELQTTLETLHETQDSLVQSEKLAALGQLIAGIAHELNTPLGAIVSSNQSMIQLIGTRLQDASRTLSGLSRDVLDWFNSALKAALDAHPLSEEAAGRYRRRKDLEARLSGSGSWPASRLVEAILDLRLEDDSSLIELVQRHPDFQDAVEALDTLVSIKSMSDVIAMAAEKCTNVVSALLYYVRKEDTEETSFRVDIIKELESLLTLYTNKIKHGVRVEKDFHCPGIVSGNRNKLNQVWMNLIQNALQAMEFKGTLGLAVEEEDSRIVVAVRDTGPGVPEHLRKRIFEPFFTTKKSGEGTGLGLDICRKIVEKHGGRIELESEPGNTVFRVFLPAWKDSEKA